MFDCLILMLKCVYPRIEDTCSFEPSIWAYVLAAPWRKIKTKCPQMISLSDIWYEIATVCKFLLFFISYQSCMLDSVIKSSLNFIISACDIGTKLYTVYNHQVRRIISKLRQLWAPAIVFLLFASQKSKQTEAEGKRTSYFSRMNSEHLWLMKTLWKVILRTKLIYISYKNSSICRGLSLSYLLQKFYAPKTQIQSKHCQRL